MNNIYLNIYNNLVKLTRNKNLYNGKKQDTFYDRMIIIFFHLSFLLKNYKNRETKKNMQMFFDYCVRQIELSIREIGYGDATINKKMKDYINLLFSIIDKINDWENITKSQKIKILKLYIDEMDNCEIYIDYFEKYSDYLSKNSFNNLSKDILTFKI
tara:strand:+ start:1211 stop:1681 length:471 start_codon:yes stop_codon:yes gene_type:complete